MAFISRSKLKLFAQFMYNEGYITGNANDPYYFTQVVNDLLKGKLDDELYDEER